MSARHHRHFQRMLRGVPRESALALAGIGECGRHASRLQGPNSIEKNWLEFWLEKPLEFRLEIPYTKKMFKNWVVT